MLYHLYKKLPQFLIFLSLLNGLGAISQTLPPERVVDWTLAGLNDTTTLGFLHIDMQAYGAAGNGLTPNDSIVSDAISSITASGAILEFPGGDFLFNNAISIPSNIIIRGQGAGSTIFRMDLGGSGHGINFLGGLSIDTTALNQSALKDSNQIVVNNPGSFISGDWVQIIQNYSDLVSSSWAYNTVGQIVRIDSISGNLIELGSPLRMNYDISRSPYLRKIIPVTNSGIECLMIQRIDNTAPEQSSNINFSYAVNCWIRGIESHNCTYSHIQARRSSNLSIKQSYFHHAFSYGSGGRGYGVMLHATSGECLVENNIFKQLRHSMILQSGANGNVFAYNYSLDAFWSTFPNDAAGDMVLHGNYVYANLFEQNICQNIVIDNSHGPNGPLNTFFRNRAEKYGIFFSAANSPFQNIIGNEITNTGLPYSLVNYSIQGNDHFVYGNNNKGQIHPSGTASLPDSSYAYTAKPSFIPAAQWSGIGMPNSLGSASTPAYDRYVSGNIFSGVCGNIPTGNEEDVESPSVLLYPNPVIKTLMISSQKSIQYIVIRSAQGQVFYIQQGNGMQMSINTRSWPDGLYFVSFVFTDDSGHSVKIVKTAVQ